MYSNHTQAAQLPQSQAAQSRPDRITCLRVYVKMLRQFQWDYAFSRSHQVARDGEENLKTMRALQCDVDPAGEIWRLVAPRGHGVPGPVVSDSIRGTLGISSYQDFDDGKREYVCLWWHEAGDTAHELSLWANSAGDALRECHERYGHNIIAIVSAI